MGSFLGSFGGRFGGRFGVFLGAAWGPRSGTTGSLASNRNPLPPCAKSINSGTFGVMPVRPFVVCTGLPKDELYIDAFKL